MVSLRLLTCGLVGVVAGAVLSPLFDRPVQAAPASPPTRGSAITTLPANINVPGCYYLDVSGALGAGSSALFVNSDDVCIDLCCNVLEGGGADPGIKIGAHTNVTIRNGHLRNWSVGVASTRDVTIEDVTLTDCVRGADVGGGSRIERVDVIGGSERGLVVDDFSVLRDCRVFVLPRATFGVEATNSCSLERVDVLGGDTGIQVTANGVVRDCTVSSTGAAALLVGPFSRIDRVIARGGSADAFVVQGRSRVVDCGARGFPSGAGVRVVGDGCQVENCTVDSCAQGIVLESKDALCVRNRAIDNTTDFVLGPNNQVGPILKSQGFVTGGQPHANFGTPIP
ncbi:MAG: hypothetical protein R3F34_12460 [Planctomycetota bacterium]